MIVQTYRILVVGMLCCLADAVVYAGGLSGVAAADSSISIQLDPSVTGSVQLLEIEPYDTFSPRRGLVENAPDSQQLDLSNAGFLRMTFKHAVPFDPQLQFPEYPVNADFVAQVSLRVRVVGTSGGADLPVRIYGVPAFQDVSLPADGSWHILRADMTAGSWSGVRTLRIDPADAQGYAAHSNTVFDIDWVAVTYRDDFTGDRNHTGFDVFIDLGVPVPSWSSTAQPEIVLPRYDGVRDRLYSKYILADGTNQIGAARFVTDLSGLSYNEDSEQGWASINTSLAAPAAASGTLEALYTTPTGPWDPGLQADSAQKVDVDAANEFAMKYRITGYTGGQPMVPMALYGNGAVVRLDDWLIPDGEWHVYRTRLDRAANPGGVWSGEMRIRIDAPHGMASVYPAAHFVGGSFELDWVAVTDNPLFTPGVPLKEGRVWEFSNDRTAPLLASRGFKGLGGPDNADKTALGIDVNKMNFLHLNAVDLSLSPAVTWPVDEFQIGINQSYLNNNTKSIAKSFSDQGVAGVITFLNRLENYWLDEGTGNQRFNPLRNYLTSTNAPNNFSVAHNVMDPVGLAWYRGTLEYMGQMFSEPSGDNGQIFRFTIGNEVDAHWSWYNLGEIEMEKVVDVYLTSCRIADLALRSQHPDFRIYVSFTHFWDKAAPQGALRAGKVKDFLDLFAAKAKAEGDFPWALCIHPYPVSLFDPTFWDDPQPTDAFSTQYITFKNLQVIRRYLQQESMLYKGLPRTINLGEQGFHVAVDGDAEDEALQAAALAYSYKITEQVPGVEAYLYHRQIDHSLEGNLRFGLGPDDPNLPGYQYLSRRPSWDVMRDYATTNETATFDPYLAYIGLTSWNEINLADIQLRYEFDEPNADITTVKLPAFGIAGGVLYGTSAANDPQIINENVSTYGDGQETMLLRLKTERAGDWQLFWKRAGDGAFSGARSVSFPVSAGNDFELYSVDLSAEADWAGQHITAWRLDPVPQGSAPYDFEIDYLIFGPKSDFDGDGIPDTAETLADSDGDGWPDLADLDSNENGWSDTREISKGWNPASVDTDGDGIPNDWEIQYGFNPHDDLEAAWDQDSDGYSSLEEHIALTDPADGFDYFHISSQSGGSAVFVDGKGGRTYSLWSASNLASNHWNLVDTEYAPAAMPIMLSDTNGLQSSFYRVEVRKQP